nr:Xaa-Pro peptidase family protein [Ardenticatena sp.]
MTTHRLHRLQAAIADADFDLVALVPGANLTYAASVALHRSERLHMLCIPAEGEAVVIAPALEAPAWDGLPVRVFTWRDEDGPSSLLRDVINLYGWESARWAIEFNNMHYGEAETIRHAAPRARFVPAEPLLTRLRMRKDADEIAHLRDAIRITEAALQRAVEAVAPGVTERDVANILRMAFFELGSEGLAFEPLVVAGARSAHPHAHASERAMQPGDVVIIDCGGVAHGYHGDITRCLALDPVPDMIQRMYDVCRRAADAGRAAVRPGIPAEDVDRAARRVIEEAGFGAYFIHRTGHGLGLDIHEPPYIVEGNQAPLEPGMVFTVEPGIYIPDVGGVRVEDVVVVTENGADVLTTYPRDLIRTSA